MIDPGSREKLPGGHARQCSRLATPGLEVKVPTGHGRQGPGPSAVLKVPAGHRAQADAPGVRLKVPAGQARQLPKGESIEADEYVPTGHATQPEPPSFAWVPAEQLLQKDSPAAEIFPAGHWMHDSILEAAKVVEYVPAGHGLQDADPGTS